MISAKIYITINNSNFQTELTELPELKTVEEAQEYFEKLLLDSPTWKTVAIFENKVFRGTVGRM